MIFEKTFKNFFKHNITLPPKIDGPESKLGSMLKMSCEPLIITL